MQSSPTHPGYDAGTRSSSGHQPPAGGLGGHQHQARGCRHGYPRGVRPSNARGAHRWATRCRHPRRAGARAVAHQAGPTGRGVTGLFDILHSFLVTEYLSQIDYLDDAIDRVSALIAQHLVAEQEAIALLDTIHGVSQRTAEILLAEIGTDMTRFPSAKHFGLLGGDVPRP